MGKKTIFFAILLIMLAGLYGCGNVSEKENITIHVDAAASLKSSFEEIIASYKEKKPDVTVLLNTGSSGTLLTQIEESRGVDHDIFFSAGAKQVDILEKEDGLTVEGTRVDLLSNQVCLVKGENTNTKVTSWDSITLAKNIALCDGTVPVGKYSRNLLVSLGFLEDKGDNSVYSSAEVSEALGGIEVNECPDVSAAAQAVAEGSNEVGFIYYSDYYDFESELEIIAMDDGTLSGEVVYPLCQIKNANCSDGQYQAVKDFLEYLQTEEALGIFEDHCFKVRR